MMLKTGTVVSHSVALEWGPGKVIEITPTMATIEFSDGKSRKIAASHFHTLQPAEASTFTPPEKTELARPTKKRTPAKSPKKKK